MEVFKNSTLFIGTLFMKFKNTFRLISCLIYLIFSLSTLNGQSCEEQADHIDSQVQSIIADNESSNAIYNTYSATDTCVWAENSWTGQIDFSGVAFDDNRTATLISPRHILMATHYQRGVGSTIAFHDSIGGIHTATLTAVESIPGGTNPDVTVGLLDVEVPVTFYRVLSPQSNWGSCLNSALVISTHHTRNASIRKVGNTTGSYINFNQSFAVSPIYYAPVVGGNSGNPNFLLINGEPILISTFTFGGSGTGPFFSEPTIFNTINSIMTTLGGGFQLETNDIDGDGSFDFQDCDDDNPNISPNQAEIAYNGIDDDCDPMTLDDDLDQDGFALADDCDDNNAEVNSNSEEITYNGIDDDCDPMTLDDDLDQDGFALADDCDDNNAEVNSNSEEITYNGIDDDCDPMTLDDDLDQDGFVLADDCDDDNSDINPKAEEIPNNDIDEDCDGNDLTTGTETLDELKITIFPNPATNHFQVTMDEVTDFTIQLFDYSGRLIFKSQTTNYMDVADYAEGVYLVKVIVGNAKGQEVWHKKIIIQR